jgi:AraC-like DNA-binding protein
VGGVEKRERWNASGTASAVMLRPMINYARSRGVEVEAVLHSIGLTLANLDEIDRRIPEAARCCVWVEVAEKAGDPFFGLHVAEQAHMGVFDVLDYSLYFSSTVDEAIDHIIRFHRVLCDGWAYKREGDDTCTRLRRVERTPRHEAEGNLAFLVLRARQLTGRELAPHEVRFPCEKPADTSLHVALFRSRLRFGWPASELAFDPKDLALPIKTANKGVEAILERYMSEMLERLPKSESFVEQVRAVVARTLCQGPPNLGKTARALHSSPRTVQRKLGEHGTRYSDVVDAVRRPLGERLVAQGNLSITEIAFLLGFVDVSGFRVAYKRWTGTSPSRGRGSRS